MDWIDIPAALGLLTRLPIRVNADRAIERGAYAVWAYPIVGLVVGGIVAILVVGLLWWGISASIAAVLMITVQVFLTGAMHEDGLADSADGLWGGWDARHRLEIMKDSHIGLYGVLALILSLMIRWAALTTVLISAPVWGLIAVAAFSRLPMVILMRALPNARNTGLSASVGQPQAVTVALAAVSALVVAAIFMGWNATILFILTIICTITVGLIARAKIGGQTGDILGASQQVTECVLLIFLTLMI